MFRRTALILALACFAAVPSAVAQQPAPSAGSPAAVGPQLALSAIFQGENRAITTGLVWRVYAVEAENRTRLVAESRVSAPLVPLAPGEYVVHVAYGLASASRKVLVGSGTTTERVPLGAGVLVVRAAIGDQPIPINRVQVSVFIPAPGNSESRLLTQSLKAGEALRLPDGVYHVVSTYAGSNSIVRADIRVSPGKVTQAQMHHRAATVTFKLVSQAGGEARANTQWSILTPGGDVIRELIGAFPSLTLAEGDYVAIARNEGQAFTGEFRVRSGVDRDIEVLARDGQRTGAASRQP
jgi:hypothetical protein